MIKTFENFEESPYYWSNLFYFLKNEKDIEFLKSLNLTKEQYSKLIDIMTEYGDERYDDGKFFDSYNENY